MNETAIAEMESFANGMEDAYFNARPTFDDVKARQLFRAGFERAWKTQQAALDKVREELDYMKKTFHAT